MAVETIVQPGAASGVAPDNYLDSQRAAVTVPDRNNYQVDKYMYPNDLFADGASNYVMFYINISENSKLVKESSNLLSGDVPNNTRGELIGKNVDAAVYASGAIQGALGGGIAGKIVNNRGTAGAAIGGGVGVGAAAIVGSQASFQRPMKRLTTAIALHVPNQLLTSYRMNWSDEEMGLTGALAALSTNPEISRKLQQFSENKSGSSAVDAASEIAKGAGSAIASVVLQQDAALSAFSGLAANPRKEQLFKSVDFRRFTMEYQFSPRSAQEANNVKEIIRLFKYHMHPEFKDPSSFLYIYPSEFEIFVYTGTQENQNIHRFTTSVLTELTVNYTPNGNFTTFADGTPTQINVNMSFVEIALLNKERIQEGF